MHIKDHLIYIPPISQSLHNMARSNIPVTDFKEDGPDIITWLNMACTSLQVSFEAEKQMVAAGLAWLGNHHMVVEAVQPPLRPVASIKKLADLKHTENLDDTLLALHKLVEEAYPRATPQEQENHLFSPNPYPSGGNS